MDIMKLSIIIVDADLQALQTTSALLKAQESVHTIQTATSGYEAVVKILKSAVDVVLMEVDLETPMAGIFLLREISAAATQVPVIMFTNRTDAETMYKAFSYGAANYLSKNVSATRLMQAINRACTRRDVLAPETNALMLKEFRRLRAMEDNLSYLVKATLSLTPTELDILRLLYGGAQVREVSRIRFIEHSTTKTHISHILQKFGLDNTAQVVALLRESNFLSILEEK
jgi:Response regulator containing a CheY-like receiver domain and an HTH DNA-binding domain